MRLVPPSLRDAFYSGNMIGDARNMARVTVQQANTKLFHLPYNLYASYIFGADATPKELPNVRLVKWQRGTDQDFATATISFYNTAPLPLGVFPTRDLDQPGYYTFNHGGTQFSQRWGTTPNEWSGVLMPDNILRSFEGYGFDPNAIPEDDPFLMSTGVWRIDDVDYTHDGVINVTARDIGSILGDQDLFPPIVPKSFWPLQFTGNPKATVGVIGPSVNTVTHDTADVSQPASWTGPVGGPATLTTVVGSDEIAVSWTRPTVADTPGGDTTKGYRVVGYQLAVDAVLLPTIYPATRFSATLGGQHSIRNGNVYSVRAIALWREVLTRKGELHFKTNVEAQVRSNFTPERVCRPSSGGANQPTVTPGSIAINVNETNTLAPGFVRFGYTNPGTYAVVAYQSDRSIPHRSYTVTTTDAGGTTHVDTGTDLGDLTEWNFLVYGRDATDVGPGDVYFAGINGAYFGAPDSGASPPPPPKTPTRTPTVKSKKDGKTRPLKTIRAPLSYDDSSNTPYVGWGEDVKVYGHDPDDAFGTADPYWLSIGNDRNDQGYSYEWIQGKCKSVTLTSVSVHTKGKHYGIYVSVFADGKWRQHSDTGVIPYNPHLPESHNHANIPYVEHHRMTDDDGEGPITITLRQPIPKVTKVRITLHNLQYFDEGGYPYRAAVRAFTAKGLSGGGTSGGVGSDPSPPPPITVGTTAGGVTSNESSTTTYTPAHIDPGLGATPGVYQDYTDIVKLFCAWAGFFWQNGAYVVVSDGDQRGVSWGVGEYGLPNVDPVLGDVDGGRVWGDFEETGTAGIVPLPPNVFAMKSLMDGISYIRDIVQFIFYVDEDGAVVWRRPNIFGIGNWIGNDAPAGTPVRISNVVELDEETVLVGLRAKLSGRNVRERIFVSTTNGKAGALAQGYNPNPTGLRRVGGWTDQYFASEEECQVMADLIALRQLFRYRGDTVTIHGYPAIQVDDQVIIVEQVTGEGFYHYVQGITSNNDMESGSGWTYDLLTNWLGERPFDNWAFSPSDLSEETQTYLDALNYGVPTVLPAGSV